MNIVINGTRKPGFSYKLSGLANPEKTPARESPMAGVLTSKQSVFHRLHGELTNIRMVQNLAKWRSHFGWPLGENQHRGVGVSACRPDYALLFGHFAGQQVLAVVVGLVHEEGTVNIHFRNGFGAQV